ncbi:MAG: pyridoxal-phosphate dependent enzyme [Treponema sp.]|nr:pyridoxal-phosphate dependent enzyme [Treponema sp.]
MLLNNANWQSHYTGTGAEIWKQTGGRVSHFICSMGTSGTFMGTSRRLKELNPAVTVIVVQPDSPFHG